MSLLALNNVHFSYRRHGVLNDVSLTVSSGEVVSLVGPNGTGKSTLLKCVNKILHPSRGDIWIHEKPMRHFSLRQLARVVAYVPQHTDAGSALSVFDMILLGRAPHIGYRVSEQDRRIVMDVIERLALRDLAFRMFGELSGGERQKVLLARALAQKSQLLLLDEPTSNLDLKNQLETMRIIHAVVKSEGLAALVAIHELNLAARFSDRLVMLKHGQVYADGHWEATLTPKNIEHVYGMQVRVMCDHGVPYIVPE
jgi:iron complex transport system ATP-binding protein